MIELGYWLVYLGIGLTLYVYIGYPLLLWVITNLYGKSHPQSNTFTEKVTLIVSCYNEADVIPDKIENCLNIEYPAELFEGGL